MTEKDEDVSVIHQHILVQLKGQKKNVIKNDIFTCEEIILFFIDVIPLSISLVFIAGTNWYPMTVQQPNNCFPDTHSKGKI